MPSGLAQVCLLQAAERHVRWGRCSKISRPKPSIRLSNPRPADKRVAAADYLNLLKHVARNGLALGVFGKGPDNTHVVVVIRKGNRPEIARLLETFAAGDPGEPERSRNRSRRAGEPFTLWAQTWPGGWSKPTLSLPIRTRSIRSWASSTASSPAQRAIPCVQH